MIPSIIDDTPCSLVAHHGLRNGRFEATVSAPDGNRLAYWNHGGIWHLQQPQDAEEAGGMK